MHLNQFGKQQPNQIINHKSINIKYQSITFGQNLTRKRAVFDIKRTKIIVKNRGKKIGNELKRISKWKREN